MASHDGRAQQFIQLIASGDFATARTFLHEDFFFVGPFDTFNAPDPYLAALQQLHGMVTGIAVRKAFRDGDDECVLYDLVTNGAAGTAFVAEWMRFREGKIASIRAVFDARPFANMFRQGHA